MNFNIEKNEINFENGEKIFFGNNLRTSIIINNVLIVVVEVIKNKITNENVFGVSLDTGLLLWQIENKSIYNCPFVHLIEKDGFLLAYNWCHYILTLNPVTGEVLKKIYDNAK